MAMKAMIPLLACMFAVASAAMYDPNASSPAPLPGHSANCGPPPPPPPPCNSTSTPPPTTTPPSTPPPTTTPPSSPPTTTPSTPPPTTTPPSSPPTTTPSTPPPTNTPSTPPPTTTPSASPPSYPGAPTAEPVIVKACAQNSIKYCNDNNPGRKRFCQKITSRCCAKYGCLPGIDKKDCPEWGFVKYHGSEVRCP